MLYIISGRARLNICNVCHILAFPKSFYQLWKRFDAVYSETCVSCVFFTFTDLG